MVSADSGRSFSLDYDGGSSIACACGGLTNVELIAVCENRTVHRRNSAGDWSAVQTLSLDAKDCVATDAGVVIISGDGHLASSVDSGATWTESDLPGTWGASLCAFADDTTGTIYLARNGQLFCSAAAGVTWTLVDTRSYESGSAYDGVMVAGGRHRSDGGNTWVDVLHPSLPEGVVRVYGRIAVDTWIAAGSIASSTTAWPGPKWNRS